MLRKTGIPSENRVRDTFPSISRIKKGPVAIVECFQRIPCNPCSTICNKKAFSPLVDINDLPVLDSDKCNGCGLCISHCPGLAIMVVDGSYSEDKVLFKIPYEFFPIPAVNTVVQGLNRAGEYIADVKVIKVQNHKSLDKTPIIHVLVDKEHLYNFRNIRMEDY